MHRSAIETDPRPDERGRVYAENPDPMKSGTNVNARTYAVVRAAMLDAIGRRREGVLFKELPGLLLERLPGGEVPGGGSIMWWTTVVKLDLEARGLLERVAGVSPQRVRRTS